MSTKDNFNLTPFIVGLYNLKMDKDKYKLLEKLYETPTSNMQLIALLFAVNNTNIRDEYLSKSTLEELATSLRENLKNNNRDLDSINSMGFDISNSEEIVKVIEYYITLFSKMSYILVEDIYKSIHFRITNIMCTSISEFLISTISNSKRLEEYFSKNILFFDLKYNLNIKINENVWMKFSIHLPSFCPGNKSEYGGILLNNYPQNINDNPRFIYMYIILISPLVNTIGERNNLFSAYGDESYKIFKRNESSNFSENGFSKIINEIIYFINLLKKF
jgi:hypothetical protein